MPGVCITGWLVYCSSPAYRAGIFCCVAKGDFRSYLVDSTYYQFRLDAAFYHTTVRFASFSRCSRAASHLRLVLLLPAFSLRFTPSCLAANLPPLFCSFPRALPLPCCLLCLVPHHLPPFCAFTYTTLRLGSSAFLRPYFLPRLFWFVRLLVQAAAAVLPAFTALRKILPVRSCRVGFTATYYFRVPPPTTLPCATTTTPRPLLPRFKFYFAFTPHTFQTVGFAPALAHVVLLVLHVPGFCCPASSAFRSTYYLPATAHLIPSAVWPPATRRKENFTYGLPRHYHHHCVVGYFAYWFGRLLLHGYAYLRAAEDTVQHLLPAARPPAASSLPPLRSVRCHYWKRKRKACLCVHAGCTPSILLLPFLPLPTTLDYFYGRVHSTCLRWVSGTLLVDTVGALR